MELEVGSVVEGRVSGITKFGAFVALPDGRSGLVHISEVANAFVSDVSEHVQMGQTVKVRVLGVSPEGKINLSIKLPPSRADEERGAASGPQRSAARGRLCGRPAQRRPGLRGSAEALHAGVGQPHRRQPALRRPQPRPPETLSLRRGEKDQDRKGKTARPGMTRTGGFSFRGRSYSSTCSMPWAMIERTCSSASE